MSKQYSLKIQWLKLEFPRQWNFCEGPVADGGKSAMFLFSIEIRSRAVALVLCTGVHPALMATRKMILERAGHRVIEATDESEIAAACKQHAFEVAVIGPMVSFDEKQRSFALIRQHCPSVKVLELYPVFLAKTLPEADDWLEVPVEAPPELAERVASLASKKPR